jgi:hypothetical protein
VFSAAVSNSEEGDGVAAGMIEINASVRIVFLLGNVEMEPNAKTEK